MDYVLCLLHRPYRKQEHHHDEHTHRKYYDTKGHELVAVYVPDHYMESLYAVVKVMQEHPETWEKYEHMEHGWADIINMEIGELQMRMKDTKAAPADIARECKHVAAACLCNYNRIQKMYE